MPQLFQVLRCFKCVVFQVHQTKKSNKWECKMCGEKQSIKRHYGLGTAKDCRLHVQKLNGIRGEVDEHKQNTVTNDDVEYEETTNSILESSVLKESKWSNYVEEIEPILIDTNSSMYLNDTEVVLELPQKRKRNFRKPYKNKVIKSDNNGFIDDDMQNVSNRKESLYSKYTSVNTSVVKTNKSSFKKEQCIRSLDTTMPTMCVKTPLSPVKKVVNDRIQIEIAEKLKPPIINKNSKWAQFADEEEEPINEMENLTTESQEFDSEDQVLENEVSEVTGPSQNKTSALFSLCDDSDLDNVLDL